MIRRNRCFVLVDSLHEDQALFVAVSTLKYSCLILIVLVENMIRNLIQHLYMRWMGKLQTWILFHLIGRLSKMKSYNSLLEN